MELIVGKGVIISGSEQRKYIRKKTSKRVMSEVRGM